MTVMIEAYGEIFFSIMAQLGSSLGRITLSVARWDKSPASGLASKTPELRRPASLIEA